MLSRILSLTALSLLFLASCSNREDDVFDTSAAQRLNHAVAENTALLESAEHGWLVELYPSEGELGGYLYSMTFSNGYVTTLSDDEFEYDKQTIAAGTPYRSLYRVKAEQECMLTFDTYIPCFHFWSEPKSSSMTSGYTTDYEFCFKSISQNRDTISLEGKKWGTRVRMIRQNTPAQGIIASAARHRANFIRSNRVVIDGASHDCQLRDGQFVCSEIGRDTTVSYAFDEHGMHFRRPVHIAGHTLTDLLIDEDGTAHTSDGSVRFVPATPMEQFCDLDRWVLVFYYYPEHRYEQPIEACQQLASAYESALFSFQEGEGIFYYMYIGKDDLYPDLDSHPYCVGWYMNYGNDNYYLADNVNLQWQGDELTITEIEPGWNYEIINQITGNKLGDLVHFFTSNSPFKVTFDDPLRPKKAKLTSKRNSDRWVSIPF